jgi:prepilin-type N-terminal cleavage/methylation domain-containing protein
MKSNNKGFTLVEILAVLSVLGVVSILIIPTMLKAFYDTRSLLSESDERQILDAAKMWMTDFDRSVNKYIYTGSGIELNGHTYANGDALQVYDWRTYVIENHGINVTMKELVEGGYYDQRCDYSKENNTCKVPETCTIKVGLEYTTAVGDRYYVVTGYTAELFNGCE